MKILITRPWNHTSMLIPNHGLAYLSSHLKSRRHQVTLLDCIRDEVDPDSFKKLLDSENFDLVGFQLYTFDLDAVAPYLEGIRSKTKRVIAGGPHPSADPIGTMTLLPDLDFCLTGESEKSFPALADLLESVPAPEIGALQAIAGLTYRHNGQIFVNPPEIIEDLDSLGFPDWPQISPASYPVAPQGTFTRRLPYAPVIISRGCPYPCTFCAGRIISGRKIRFRSVDHVIKELKFLAAEYGIREFHIQDDNFTFNKDYVMRFCEALRQSGLDLTFACPNGIRLDSIDEEMIHAMSQAGCYSVAVGIESGCQRILDLMKKQTTLNEIVQKIRLIRKTSDWLITGFFILGYPGETREEIEKTIRFSRRLPIDKVNYGILMPLPGTGALSDAQERGYDPVSGARRMSEYRSSFTPEGMTPREFRSTFRRAFIRFYARPHIIWRFIRQIQSIDQVKILYRRFMDVVKP